MKLNIISNPSEKIANFKLYKNKKIRHKKVLLSMLSQFLVFLSNIPVFAKNEISNNKFYVTAPVTYRVLTEY